MTKVGIVCCGFVGDLHAAAFRMLPEAEVVAVEEEAVPAGPLALERTSVVLLTGGARGITARLAIALARSTGCCLELVGRSPLPDAPEDDDLAEAADAASLRRAFIARGLREPARIEAACAEAIAQGVYSANVVLNILARQRDPGPPLTILTPAALTLRHAPIADCARYDNLRRTI